MDDLTRELTNEFLFLPICGPSGVCAVALYVQRILHVIGVERRRDRPLIGAVMRQMCGGSRFFRNVSRISRCQRFVDKLRGME